MSRDGIELVVGRESITYYTAGAVLNSADVRNYNATDDDLARDHPRLRRVLLRLGRAPSEVLSSMVLHWSDGSDLNELDDRLRAGDTRAEHFAHAVVGEFAHHLCPQCDLWFRVVDCESIGTRGLGVAMDDILRHTFLTTCPNCGAPTRRTHPSLAPGVPDPRQEGVMEVS
ncbi:MAG: hypothetical protein ACRDP6_03290 [Actinoallomurus sp.]